MLMCFQALTFSCIIISGSCGGTKSFSSSGTVRKMVTFSCSPESLLVILNFYCKHMVFHTKRKYHLITTDNATPSKDWKDGLQTTADACPHPFPDLPVWRNSALAAAGYNTAESSNVSAMTSLHKTLSDLFCVN